MESLWNALDDYLATQLLAALGSAGSYATLRITQVDKLAQVDVQDWTKSYAAPFQIVMSFQSRAVAAGHDGSSTIKRDVEYSVVVISVCEGTPADATRDAKILVHRTEKLLATLNFAGVAATDGSLLRGRPRGSSSMFASVVELFPHPSQNRANLRYGVGTTAFSITGLTV
jgi:hypothetical protein